MIPGFCGISGFEMRCLLKGSNIRKFPQFRACQEIVQDIIAHSIVSSIRICTYNVQAQPPMRSVRDWILENASFQDPDLYVFGMQELDRSVGALLYTTSTVKEDAWFDAIMGDLGDRSDSYQKVSPSDAPQNRFLLTSLKLFSTQLVGLLIIILVRKELRHRIKPISSSSAGIGVLNTLGNKGGVAARLQVDDTVLCFVNCHLQAFEDMTEKRNADFHELTRRLTFPSVPPSEDIAATIGPSVFESDVVFWLVISPL